MEQALGQAEETRRAAEALGHPYTRAYAAGRTALIHHVRRDVDAARAAAEAALDLGTAHGFELICAQASVLRGWALAMQGETGEGLALMAEGQAAWEKAGAVILRPLHLALLAEGLARADRLEEALAQLADARATAERTGERWWEAELHRLTGELSFRRTRRPSEAVQWLEQAVLLARRQGARSLELRAAVGLSRHSRGAQRARWTKALRATYAQFTEGRDSGDLREARTQLRR
jgi:predicted ATPase